jgi:hypothetical protein
MRDGEKYQMVRSDGSVYVDDLSPTVYRVRRRTDRVPTVAPTVQYDNGSLGKTLFQPGNPCKGNIRNPSTAGQDEDETVRDCA